MKLLLATYPRSGQHYLVDLVKQQLNYNLDYTHDPVISGYDNYITIIRDPFDCILSWVVMEMHCGPAENSKQFSMEEYINKAIQEYILFYTYILRRIDVIFCYNDLISRTDSIVEYISRTYKINKESDKYFSTILDNTKGRFLKTSTKSNLFDIVKSNLQNKNLSECYKLYNLALNQSIMFDI